MISPKNFNDINSSIILCNNMYNSTFQANLTSNPIETSWISYCYAVLYNYYKNQFKISASDFTKSFLQVLYQMNSFKKEKEIVSNIMTNAKERNGCLQDSVFTYFLVGHGPWPPKGSWFSRDGRCGGNNLINFITSIKGISISQAFLFVAKNCQTDLSARDVVQIDNVESYTWIQNPIQYIKYIPSECNLASLLNQFTLGLPICCYNFFDIDGVYSFSYLEFFYDGQTIYLAVTVQQNEIYGVPTYELIAPPIDNIVLNKHLIRNNLSKSVFIFYDIFMANWFNHNHGIPLWLGDLSVIKKADLSFINVNKEIIFIFDIFDPVSVNYGLVLIDKLYKFGMKPKLVPVDRNNVYSIISNGVVGTMSVSPFEFLERRKTIISSLNASIPHEMSQTEYYELAKRLHGLDLQPNRNEATSISCNIEELNNKTTKSNYLIEPLCREGELVLLAAEGKTGKSWFAGDIAQMVASGESFNRLSAPEPKPVLLVDTEMSPDQIGQRLSMLKKLYKNEHIVERNLKVISLFRIGKRLDLLIEEDRKWFEDQIGDAKFIIIDNLGGVMSFAAERNPEQWRVISVWLRALCYKLKITIFIVHHTNKAGEHRGTEKIKDDVDLMIMLRRPDDCPDEETKFEVHFPYARFIGGDARKGFVVQYEYAGENIKRSVYTLDGKELVPRNKITSDEIERLNLSELEIIILSKVRNSEFVVARDFIDSNFRGRSSSTVTECLKGLVEKNLIYRIGVGSGTKYRAVNDPLSFE